MNGSSPGVGRWWAGRSPVGPVVGPMGGEAVGVAREAGTCTCQLAFATFRMHGLYLIPLVNSHRRTSQRHWLPSGRAISYRRVVLTIFGGNSGPETRKS
jgi:hypothetical protein